MIPPRPFLVECRKREKTRTTYAYLSGFIELCILRGPAVYFFSSNHYIKFTNTNNFGNY